MRAAHNRTAAGRSEPADLNDGFTLRSSRFQLRLAVATGVS